jgi:hypothetical protein
LQAGSQPDLLAETDAPRLAGEERVRTALDDESVLTLSRLSRYAATSPAIPPPMMITLES